MSQVITITCDLATDRNIGAGITDENIQQSNSNISYERVISSAILAGPTGLQGPKGDKGDKGDTGNAATISVGTTSTLAPGSSATVNNSGSSSAAIFDFGIPQGAIWYTGSGAPSTAHNNGDLYLNTSNGDVYKQTSGAWGSPIANLTGPQGSAGSASGSDTQVQFNDGGSFAGSAGLTYNKTTHALSATGAITGSNLSGNNTGDQTTITGNAGTATKLQTARTIGGVSFDGSANVNLVPSNIGLGNVTNDAQLKVTSNLSDVASTSTARSNLGAAASGSNTDITSLSPSNGKLAVNGASANYALNVKGSGLTARMQFQGGAGDNPGVELTNDSTGTRRVLMRLNESGTSGTEIAYYTRPDAGGSVVNTHTMKSNGDFDITGSYKVNGVSLNADAQYGWLVPTS